MSLHASHIATTLGALLPTMCCTQRQLNTNLQPQWLQYVNDPAWTTLIHACHQQPLHICAAGRNKNDVSLGIRGWCNTLPNLERALHSTCGWWRRNYRRFRVLMGWMKFRICANLQKQEPLAGMEFVRATHVKICRCVLERGE
jgi:hypothetical protein